MATPAVAMFIYLSLLSVACAFANSSCFPERIRRKHHQNILAVQLVDLFKLLSALEIQKISMPPEETLIKKWKADAVDCTRVYLKRTEHFSPMTKSYDPEIRSWFLVRNNYLPFILCGYYVLFSTIVGPTFMKHRKPYQLRRTMVVFNLFLVSIYGTFLLVGLFCLPYITKEQFCYGMKVKKGDVSYTITSAGWLIYIVKYIEFFDTVFFILRKKENLVSFLHVSHHTVVPLFGWLIMRTENSGLQAIPATVNAIVHFIMYSYYALAAMGPRVRKYLWWKKYLTQLQMAQMVVISIFITLLAPLTGCKMVLSSYIIDSIIFPFYFYLFYRFYKTRFMPKAKSLQENVDSVNDTVRNEQTNKEFVQQGLRKDTPKKQK